MNDKTLNAACGCRKQILKFTFTEDAEKHWVTSFLGGSILRCVSGVREQTWYWATSNCHLNLLL